MTVKATSSFMLVGLIRLWKEDQDQVSSKERKKYNDLPQDEQTERKNDYCGLWR